MVNLLSRDAYVALLVGLFRGKDVIYVGNDDGCDDIVPMRSLVKAPKQNAFAEFDEIKASALYEAGKYEQPVVVASCGITATALAWDLNMAGVPAYDVGLIFGRHLKAEWNAGARDLVTGG